jgi:hypothetical protein
VSLQIYPVFSIVVKIEIRSINPNRAVMSIPTKINQTRTPKDRGKSEQNQSRFCPDLTNGDVIL